MIRVRRASLSGTVSITTLILFTLFAVLPFYLMMIMCTYSTQTLQQSSTFLPGRNLFSNLKTVLSSGFLRYYGNSLTISIVGTFLCVLVSTLAGYGFAKFDFPLKKGLFIFVISAMMVPRQLVVIGYVIEMRSLSLSGTSVSLIISYIANCFGVFWMTQYIKGSLSDSLLESARIDGCPEVRIFFQIAVPCIAPAIGTLTILEFMWIWNDYFMPLVLLNKPELFTVPLGIAALGTRYQTDFAAQITGLALGTIPVLVVFLLGAKTFIKGITAGAVKG